MGALDVSFEDDLLAAAKESAVERYLAKEAIASIARSFGVTRYRVYKWLTEAGAYASAPSPGAQRKPTCQVGHDMEVWGREIKSGGRYCLRCKRVRDAVSARTRYHANRHC